MIRYGVVQWYDAIKGYGFICPSGGNPNSKADTMFVHRSDILLSSSQRDKDGVIKLVQDQKVTFKIVVSKDGRSRATNVSDARTVRSHKYFSRKPKPLKITKSVTIRQPSIPKTVYTKPKAVKNAKLAVTQQPPKQQFISNPKMFFSKRYLYRKMKDNKQKLKAKKADKHFAENYRKGYNNRRKISNYKNKQHSKEKRRKKMSYLILKIRKK